jgi:hypothetical protein
VQLPAPAGEGAMSPAELAKVGSGAPPAFALARMSPRLRNVLAWQVIFRRLVMEEVRSPLRLPLRKALSAWRRGFLSQTYLLYDLDRNDPSDYLSDYAQRMRSARVNALYGFCLSNKYGCALLMEHLGCAHPAVHGLVLKGVLRRQDGTTPGDVAQYLISLIAREGGLVLKPVWSSKGRGIVFLTEKEGRLLLNGRTVSPTDLPSVVRRLDNYLVTSFVAQAEYARRMYPEATNTIRLLTAWDLAQDAPFITVAAHRIGTSRSRPVDSFKGGLGGLSASLDMETGTLGPAVGMDSAGRRRSYSHHPETGAAIAGVQVPFWQAMKDMVLSAAGRTPQLPYVGWDMAVTDVGPCVIELNDRIGLYVWEVHGGVLRDERVRIFLKSCGFI